MEQRNSTTLLYKHIILCLSSFEHFVLFNVYYIAADLQSLHDLIKSLTIFALCFEIYLKNNVKSYLIERRSR